VTFDDDKVVLYRNQLDGWVAEIPALPGCYALMDIREEAPVELKFCGARRKISLSSGALRSPARIYNPWRKPGE
jgi:hypothetical protein